MILFDKDGKEYIFNHYCDYIEALNGGFYLKNNPVVPVEPVAVDPAKTEFALEEDEPTKNEVTPTMSGIRKKKIIKEEKG
jgi:hypothetical protein